MRGRGCRSAHAPLTLSLLQKAGPAPPPAKGAPAAGRGTLQGDQGMLCLTLACITHPVPQFPPLVPGQGPAGRMQPPLQHCHGCGEPGSCCGLPCHRSPGATGAGDQPVPTVTLPTAALYVRRGINPDLLGRGQPARHLPLPASRGRLPGLREASPRPLLSSAAGTHPRGRCISGLVKPWAPRLAWLLGLELGEPGGSSLEHSEGSQ